jgi:hypothetical protein
MLAITYPMKIIKVVKWAHQKKNYKRCKTKLRGSKDEFPGIVCCLLKPGSNLTCYPHEDGQNVNLILLETGFSF